MAVAIRRKTVPRHAPAGAPAFYGVLPRPLLVLRRNEQTTAFFVGAHARQCMMRSYISKNVDNQKDSPCISAAVCFFCSSYFS